MDAEVVLRPRDGKPSTVNLELRFDGLEQLLEWVADARVAGFLPADLHIGTPIHVTIGLYDGDMDDEIFQEETTCDD